MAGVWPHGKAIRPAGKTICGLLTLLLALCCFACGRQAESSMFAVAAAPAATLPASGRRIPVAADAYISSWSPDATYAAAKSLVARSDGAKSLLLRFDLTQVAESAPDRVVLRLYVLRAGALPLTLRAYPLVRPWDARAVSWRQAAYGSSWSLPGASNAGHDRADQPVAMALVARQESWIELDLSATVQEWLARPDHNYGILLTGSALEAVECELASSERRAEQSPYLELGPSKKGSPVADLGIVTCGTKCGLVDTTISASFPESNLSVAQTLELDANGSRAILMRFGNLPGE